MKKKIVVLAAFAALGAAAYLANQLWAQTPGVAPTATAGTKVGLVNMALILKGYNKFKVYTDEIEKIRLKYEKEGADAQLNLKKCQDLINDPKTAQPEREKYQEYMKGYKRILEDLADKYNKERTKKSEDQMVQMYHEVEEAVGTVAKSNGFHVIFHYSEPLTDAEKSKAENIQRKLLGPGQSGGICPLYVANGIDVSLEVVNSLNTRYPVAAAPPATAPAAAVPPKQ